MEGKETGKENAKQLAKKGYLALSKEKKEFIDFEGIIILNMIFRISNYA